MIFRICDMGTRSPGMEGGGTAAGRVAGDGVAGEAAGAAAEPRSTKSRTSCFVTRPPVPVPLIFARSTLCSRASLRTSGEERMSDSSRSETAFHEVEDILLRDAAAGASATDFCEIHVVFAREFANERGGANVGFILFFRLFTGSFPRSEEHTSELQSL